MKFPYEIWLTVTFENPRSTSYAKKRFKHYLKHLNDGMVFYQKYIHLWIFFEKNKVKSGIHIHALIHGIDIAKAPLLEQDCNVCFGESKVIVGHKNVIPYVADKYNRPSLDDFDYWKINSRKRKK